MSAEGELERRPLTETERIEQEIERIEKETNRIEAFSDGVFAIAITLLVLELKVPHLSGQPGAQSLAGALLAQWPSYLAFAISFITILIMWMNHHMLFTHIFRTDHTFLLINGLVLMGVTIVPFPTALVAEYLQHPDERIAVLVYDGVFVFIAVAFYLLWNYAAHEGRLLNPEADKQAVADITRGYRFGPLFYVTAFVVGLFSAGASLALCALLALYFAVPRSLIRV